MKDWEIENLANEVLSAYRQVEMPVDLAFIASEEGIELLEGEYGAQFHGRIEYLPEVQTFAIYHPPLKHNRYPGHVRFSIGHELAHYYIPAHRRMLEQGMRHNSSEGFRPDDEMENQADQFAAALLFPAAIMKARMGVRGFLSLQQIRKLADDCDGSLQAAAFRYTRFTSEPHLAVVSEGRSILYYFTSDEARAIGFSHLGNREIPERSSTERALAHILPEIEQGATQTERWFSERQARAELWEEAIRLGSSNRVITLLSWQKYNPH